MPGPEQTTRKRYIDQALKDAGWHTYLTTLLILILIVCTTEEVMATNIINPQPGIQDNTLHFEHLDYEHGLSQVSVLDILQDNQGFLWFATADGLNRYDGYSMTVFRYKPGDETSLSSNYCQTLYEDHAGNLWVGTLSEGLNRFDRESGTFTRYRFDPGNPHSLQNDAIHTLHEDQSGNLWIGTGDGLSIFNPETERFERVDFAGLKEVSVHTLYTGSDGLIWIGTEKGLYTLDPQYKTVISYEAPSLGNLPVRIIYGDTSGQLWLGTEIGLYRLRHANGKNLTEDEITYYTYKPHIPHSLSHPSIVTIIEDQTHTLWIGTEGGGLNRLTDLEASADAVFIHDYHIPEEEHSLSDNLVQSIFIDRGGIMWIGTRQGALNKYNARMTRFVNYQYTPEEPDSLSGKSVWAIATDSAGDLWIGTSQGLDRLTTGDTGATHYQHYYYNPNNARGLSNEFVRAIHEDQAGNLWVGTAAGLDRWNQQTGDFIHYTNKPDNPQSLSGNFIQTIYEDRQGTLWIGTTTGLNRLEPGNIENPATAHFTRYTHQANDKQSLSHNRIRAIYEDHAGYLWVGTEVGLNRFDREKQTFTHYYNELGTDNHLSSNFILSLYEDQNGVLWIGTYQGGLNKLDQERSTFTAYHEENGLPNDVVYGILEDEQGYLWLSTNKGIAKFDPRTESFETYDAGDGLQSNEFNAGAYHKAANGNLYFGGINGVSMFTPGDIIPNPVTPPIVLTAMSQGGEPLTEDRAITGLDTVTLKWPQNFFEFEFAALSYANPGKNQYAYRLDPFDEDWVYGGTRRFGRYTNLPGGTYTLQLKGANNDGIWNETGTTLNVTVIPPFWATWKFRAVSAIILTGGIIAGYRWRVRSVEARAQELAQLVTARTTELQQANEQLQAEIAERERAETALAQQAAAVAVAAERNRLARDLHDAVTQTLFSANLIADILPRIWAKDPEQGQRQLAEIRQLTRGALAEMRALLLELRPEALIEAKMSELLEQLGRAMTGRTGIPVNVAIEGTGQLPPDVQVTFYRVTQEALNNASKYAEASNVEVNFKFAPDWAILAIKDNGGGFIIDEVPAGHFGLNIMHERATAIGAELSIESRIGEGTGIMVIWRMKDNKETTTSSERIL